MASSFFKLEILKQVRAKSQKPIKKLLEIEERAIVTSKHDAHPCRICLKPGIIPIYSFDQIFNTEEAIRTFGDIEIQKNDTYPKHLCEACHSLLNGAVLFRKSAKESDLFLRNAPHNLPQEIEDDSDFIQEESIENTHKCERCNVTFNTLQEYTSHKSSKRHKNVRIQCPICHRLFTSQLYKNHQKRHESASHLICEVCGKLYRKDNLLRHLQLHTYDLPFQCQMCPYRGRFLESLKIHMRIHSGEKPFSCDSCNLQFATRSNLNRHLLTHRKEKPHKCIECGRGFHTKRDMDVHFKADHNSEKEFGCSVCQNKYSTRKALLRHELRVHKRDKMAKGRMPLYLQADYRKIYET